MLLCPNKSLMCLFWTCAVTVPSPWCCQYFHIVFYIIVPLGSGHIKKLSSSHGVREMDRKKE